MDQLEQGLVSLSVSSPDEVPSSMEDGFSALPPEVPDVGNLESEIPGLDSAVHSDDVPSSMGILLIIETGSGRLEISGPQTPHAAIIFFSSLFMKAKKSVMASPSGTSSGSSLLQNSGSDENLQSLRDQRKRKRMISNRESARRSRMKKQRHLDDLNSQLAQLRKENNQIITRFNVTSQEFLKIESENSILRAQVAELSHRLQSLNEIICFWNSGNDCFGSEDGFNASDESVDGLLLNNPLMSYVYLNQQPIMASVDMLQY